MNDIDFCCVRSGDERRRWKVVYILLPVVIHETLDTIDV